MTAGLESRYLEVLDSRIHYLEAGEGDLILFIAGNPVSSYSWRKVIPYLRDSGHCVAVDPIGMGKSGKPKIRYTYADQARYLTAFLDQLARHKDLGPLERMTLVLHGWGAALGLDYAAQHSQAVRGVALMEPVLRTPMLEDMSLARKFHTPEGEEMVLEQNWYLETMLFSQLPGLTEEEKDAYREPFPTPESRRPILQWARMAPIDDQLPGIREVVSRYSSWLRSTEIPKLLLHHIDHPTPGMLMTPDLVRDLRCELTNFSDLEIGEAGHYAQEEQPARIGQGIAAWLKALGRGGSGGPGLEQKTSEAVEMTPPYPPELVQELVDKAAPFCFYAAPGGESRGSPIWSRDGESVVGVQLNQPVYLMDIEMARQSAAGVRARNSLRGPVATLTGQLLVIPPSYRALPDRRPPEEPLDPSESQRFVLQEAVLTINEETSLSLFGTGRTLPMLVGDKTKLLAAGNTAVVGGTGAFEGLTGFVSLGGEIQLEQGGYFGSVFARILDPGGRLSPAADLEPHRSVALPSNDYTYLHWQVTKGHRAQREPNWFSFAPDGQPRSINTPVFLRHLALRTSIGSSLRSHRILGDLVARERGLGIPTEPETPESGTTLKPIPFQGVAEDIFYAGGVEIGRIHINWLEGQVIRVQFPEVPGQVTRRFGFYGFILRGSGCFSGAQGIVHGAGGGALDPPLKLPDQAFDNYYVVQLNDPQHRFQSPSR